MKKLSIICMVTLLIALPLRTLFAIEYCKDFLEPGNPGGWGTSAKTWDEELTLGVTEEISVDVWLNDCPEDMVHAGFWIEYDPGLLSLVSVDAYDENDLPGPWSYVFTRKVPDIIGPGSYWVWLGIGVRPDFDGDIILGRVRFRAEAVGDATITIVVDRDPGFTSVLGEPSAHVYDDEIPPNIITLHQIIAPCCTRISPDPVKVFAGKTIQFEANKSGTCNPSSYVWSDDCVHAAVDPITGLFTAEMIEEEEACSVCVIDTANQLSCSNEECVPPADCCAHFTITNDVDDDGVADADDNCPTQPNGPDLGTCIYGSTLGQTCTAGNQCGTNGFCSMNQEDNFPPGGNGVGEACECEGNFDGDGDVDGSDAAQFKADFGRSTYQNPCPSTIPTTTTTTAP